MKCIFCDIIEGKIPSTKLYEDEVCIVIRDIEPKAPLHYLMIPKQHYATLDEMDDSQAQILGSMLQSIKNFANLLGLSEGYRLVINQREHGGQTVMHMHIHLLGGEKLGWTPG